MKTYQGNVFDLHNWFLSENKELLEKLLPEANSAERCVRYGSERV